MTAGAVTMYANYTRRDPVFQDAREFSERAGGDGCITPGTTGRGGIGTPFPSGIAVGTCLTRGGELGFVPQGSATGPTGTFVAGPAGAQSPFIFNPSGGGSRPFQDPADLFNFAPDNYLQLPQERYLLGAYGHYEFSDGIEAYSELSFVRNVVSQELAPTPAGVSAPLFVNSPFFNDQTRALLLQNPVAATGANYRTTQVNFRFADIGSRNSYASRDAFRVLAGVRGAITARSISTHTTSICARPIPTSSRATSRAAGSSTRLLQSSSRAAPPSSAALMRRHVRLAAFR